MKFWNTPEKKTEEAIFDYGSSSPTSLMHWKAKNSETRQPVLSCTRMIGGLRLDLGVLLCTLALGLEPATPVLGAEKGVSKDQFYDIDIPSQNAADALNSLAQQTGAIMLFPYELAQSRNTRAISGRYSIEQALTAMLEGSGLSGSLTASSVIQITAIAADSNNNETPGEETMRAPARRKLFGIFGLASSIAAAAAANAQAQEQPASIEEISVTGSRIRQTGMQTPTPVTAIAQDEMELLSSGTLMDQLDQLPQFVNNNTLQQASGWTATGGQATLNLRGVGGNRTLVLLDGRRIVPSNRLSTVDTAMFPQALIQRTEVVTGGASAAYGSDAITGVVNFILNTDFEGLSASVQGGISELGDRPTGRYSVAGGFSLGERAHVIMGGELFEAGEIPNYDDRDWYQAWGDINFGATAGVPNRVPQRIRVPNIFTREFTLGGLIVSSPLAGTQFLADGTPVPFVNGDIMDATAVTAARTGRIAGAHAGGNASGDQIARHDQVLASQERGNFFSHLKYELSDTTTLSLQGIYGRGKVVARKGGYIFSRPLDEVTIYQDNAFLPEQLRTRMINENIQSFVLHKQVSPEDLLNNSVNGAPQTTTMFSLTGAIDGSFSFFGKDWDYSAYYQYGESLRHLKLYGHRNDRTYRAIDSIRHPVTGEIICRSTLSEPNDGCVPLNMFGRNNESQAARDWVHDVAFTDTEVSQHATEILVSGTPWQIWAGDISVAAGLSYRKDYLDQIGCDVGGCPIPLVGQGPVRTPVDANGNPIYRGLPPALVGRQIMELTTGALIVGGYNVKEAFTEFQIPLLRDVPFANSLDINLATRYADYQGSGGIWAWKAGLDWQIVDDLRFRLTRSRDIRAASLAERYDQSTGGANVTDPFLNDAVYIVSTMQGGNPNVLPEYADTLTFGAVYQPSWLPEFSASIDFYDIQLTDAISLLGLADIVNECYRVGAFCDMINRDANGLIQTVRNIYINIDETRTTGMDIELQYRQPINIFGGGENIRLRAIGSHLSEASITPYIGDKIDSVGVLNYADWQVMLSASYIRGPLSVSWTENWRSSVKRDRLWRSGIDVDNNIIPSQSMSNLRVTYGFERGSGSYSIYGMVTNVFDRNPSRVNGLNNIWGDIGREYTLGLTYRY